MKQSTVESQEDKCLGVLLCVMRSTHSFLVSLSSFSFFLKVNSTTNESQIFLLTKLLYCSLFGCLLHITSVCAGAAMAKL